MHRVDDRVGNYSVASTHNLKTYTANPRGVTIQSISFTQDRLSLEVNFVFSSRAAAKKILTELHFSEETKTRVKVLSDGPPTNLLLQPCMLTFKAPSRGVLFLILCKFMDVDELSSVVLNNMKGYMKLKDEDIYQSLAVILGTVDSADPAVISIDKKSAIQLVENLYKAKYTSVYYYLGCAFEQSEPRSALEYLAKYTSETSKEDEYFKDAILKQVNILIGLPSDTQKKPLGDSTSLDDEVKPDDASLDDEVKPDDASLDDETSENFMHAIELLHQLGESDEYTKTLCAQLFNRLLGLKGLGELAFPNIDGGIRTTLIFAEALLAEKRTVADQAEKIAEQKEEIAELKRQLAKQQTPQKSGISALGLHGANGCHDSSAAVATEVENALDSSAPSSMAASN